MNLSSVLGHTAHCRVILTFDEDERAEDVHEEDEEVVGGAEDEEEEGEGRGVVSVGPEEVEVASQESHIHVRGIPVADAEMKARVEDLKEDIPFFVDRSCSSIP